jgi:DNA-binding NarL/FixJ family response regulator
MRVYVIESRAIVRAALQALLAGLRDCDVLEAVDDTREDFERVLRLEPDLVVVGQNLRGDGTLELIGRLRREASFARVLFLSDSHDPELHRRAREHGAAATLTTYESVETLHDTIRQLAPAAPAGERAKTNGASGAASGASAQDADPLCRLTGRERAVAALVAGGLRNKKIAERLFISEGTVRRHLNAVFAKVGVENRVQLANLVKHGERRAS